MERYEIIIKDEVNPKDTNTSGEENGKKVDDNTSQGKDEKKEKKEKGISAKVVGKMAIQQAKQLIVPHIGEYARDTLLQQKVDDVMTMISMGTSFAIHPVVGLVEMTTTYMGKIMSFEVERQKQQNQLEASLRRASYINRSRD